MKKTFAVLRMCSVLGVLNFQAGAEPICIPQPEPYTNDAHTVLLEHFDGVTSGSPSGAVAYTNGMFGSGIHLGEFSFVSWELGGFAEGTLEFWGKLDTAYLPRDGIGQQGFAFFVQAGRGWPLSWFTSCTAIVATNRVRSTFGASSGPCTNVTANVWHHYATTWGGQGFHFYFDGALVYSATNTQPQDPATEWWAIGGSGHGIMPSGIIGVIDELRISDVQRTFACLPRPSLSIGVSKVKVTQYVVVGHSYVIECSSDLDTWTQMGDKFTATTGSLTAEYDVDVVGRFFRIREVL